LGGGGWTGTGKSHGRKKRGTKNLYVRGGLWGRPKPTKNNSGKKEGPPKIVLPKRDEPMEWGIYQEGEFKKKKSRGPKSAAQFSVGGGKFCQEEIAIGQNDFGPSEGVWKKKRDFEGNGGGDELPRKMTQKKKILVSAKMKGT